MIFKLLSSHSVSPTTSLHPVKGRKTTPRWAQWKAEIRQTAPWNTSEHFQALRRARAFGGFLVLCFLHNMWTALGFYVENHRLQLSVSWKTPCLSALILLSF